MHRRCGSVDVEGIAILPKYRLAFAGWSARWRGAVATIIPSVTENVPGVLYRVGHAGLEALDRFEGAPRVYRRTAVRVFGADERWQRAQAYLLEEVMEGCPSVEYLAVLRRAYRAWGFDRVRLFAKPTSVRPHRGRAAVMINDRHK